MKDNTTNDQNLRIGWASTDITPDRPAVLGGMPSARISRGVMDPITATALALETDYPGQTPIKVILISCDLRGIRNEVRDEVRARLRSVLPDVGPTNIILNATHTHTSGPLGDFGIELDAMQEYEYRAFIIPRIAAVAEQAWKNRRPGGISFGLAHAVAGHNRLTAYFSGNSKMYGKTDDSNFSHVEGYEDHSVNLLYTWNKNGGLTGIMINLAVPSQVSADSSKFSADFWHDTRVELRRRLGDDLFVLPQCSAAGDQSPLVLVNKKAEARMEMLTGRNRRQQIAARIADAATGILPCMEQNIEWQPKLAHHCRTLQLSRRIISAQDLTNALAEAKPWQEKYEKLRREIESNSELKKKPNWYKDVTRAYWNMRRGRNVEERFELQKTTPYFPAEVHVLRIGDMVIVTNPFELYLDFGVQIKARSPAIQTFVVQLAGGGSYVPTARSVAGGAYGAVPASTQIGPEGGHELVEQTLAMITELWKYTADDITGEVNWPGEWVVFVQQVGFNSEASRTLPFSPKTLRTIPEEIKIEGEKLIARKVTPQGDQFDFATLFGRTESGRTAYVFLHLESAVPQEVTLGFGADWWMEVWLNGKRILDTTGTGNIAWPPSILDYLVRAELRRGMNVLAVRFVSGSGSSILALSGPGQLRKKLFR